MEISYTEKQLQNLATITSRFANLHAIASNSYKTLNELKFNTFKHLLNEDESKTMQEALKLVERIRNNTGQTDAVNHFKQELKATELKITDFSVQHVGGYYRYINHPKKLASTGYYLTGHLEEYGKTLVFDAKTISEMKEIYYDLF